MYAGTIKTNVLRHIILQKIVPLLGNYKKYGRFGDIKEIAVYLNKLWCHIDDRRMRVMKRGKKQTDPQ